MLDKVLHVIEYAGPGLTQLENHMTEVKLSKKIMLNFNDFAK